MVDIFVNVFVDFLTIWRFDRLFMDSLNAVLSQQAFESTARFFKKIYVTNFVTLGWKNYNTDGTNLGIGSPT